MKHSNLGNYISMEFDELNRLTTDLYESMHDQENEEVVRIASELIDRLKHIQQSHK